MKRIGIIGGGVAGVAAAYFLSRVARAGTRLEVELFEASSRLGGIVETVHEGGFVVECGPDAWVTEKPWATQLVQELGLSHNLIYSLDATRKTYIRLNGRLEAMPDGMRMMVPSNLAALDASTLFTETAKRAYRDEISRAQELRALAPGADESVASFVQRHFGEEVLTRIAAPLLSGVFGGDVEKLSMRAVMPAFVEMERKYGSLVLAVQEKASGQQKPIFTTLRNGMEELVQKMVEQIPPGWLRLGQPVRRVARAAEGWEIGTADGRFACDELLMAAPVDIARDLLKPIDERAAELMVMEASSAVIVAFCFTERLVLPPGFGFLVPPAQESMLLACTFTDQKFADRVPPGGRIVRAFFGGSAAERLMHCGNDEIASVARLELGRILGPMPEPVLTVVRRWPRSLPQYGVGHLDRMQELERRVEALGGFHLLGNAYRGVGVPDLIRDARYAVDAIMAGA